MYRLHLPRLMSTQMCFDFVFFDLQGAFLLKRINYRNTDSRSNGVSSTVA